MTQQFFSVLHEDNHLILVSKANGVLAQEDSTADLTLADYVKHYLKEKYSKQGNVFCGVVHRLDRPVSGLVIMAKTSKALARMHEIFRERQIEKTYYAIVNQAPPQKEGKLVHWLTRNPNTNITKAHRKEVSGSQYAELYYDYIAEKNGWHLLKVKPVTGRTHQIRVQLASIGCIIAGDVRYGFPKVLPEGGICLHSFSVKFMHPVRKEPLYCEAPPPMRSLWNLFFYEQYQAFFDKQTPKPTRKPEH